jgi:hypothetical protein
LKKRVSKQYSKFVILQFFIQKVYHVLKNGDLFSTPKIYPIIPYAEGETMHLYETEEGDRWVCVNCAKERKEELEKLGWKYIFDRDDLELRCSICGKPDYDFEDFN